MAKQISDEDRGDVRAGTWGAVAVDGAIVVGLLLHAQILFALVAGAVLLVTIALCRVILTGVMYSVASPRESWSELRATHLLRHNAVPMRRQRNRPMECQTRVRPTPSVRAWRMRWRH